MSEQRFEFSRLQGTFEGEPMADSQRNEFNPAKYLTKVGKADYLEVKFRILWLREVHPDAQITTELIAHDPQRQWAMFRAYVSIPGGGAASGHGSEDVGGFREYIEKAETKAIGRALGALGFGTQFADDFDMGGKVVDSPIGGDRAPQGTTAHENGTPRARSGVPPTEPQFKKVAVLARNLRMTDGQLHEFAGVPSLNDLDRAQMSALIEKLQALEGEGPDATDAPDGWTGFWAFARTLGFNDKLALEAQIGVLGADPTNARQRLDAWAKTSGRLLAVVS